MIQTLKSGLHSIMGLTSRQLNHSLQNPILYEGNNSENMPAPFRKLRKP